MKIAKLFAFIFLLFPCFVFAATGKYCNQKGSTYDIHIFAYTFKEENSQKRITPVKPQSKVAVAKKPKKK